MSGVLAGILALGAGAAPLWWGAEAFLDHVASLAGAVRLPVVAAGLLLAGAEPEEMATALMASARGYPVLAVTDALGANVTMSTLGLGLALLVAPPSKYHSITWYALAAAGAGAGAGVALADGRLGRPETALLVAGYVVVVALVWVRQRQPPAFGELAELDTAEGPGRPGRRPRAVAFLLAGLAAMVAGGVLAVDGAARLAVAAGLGEQATGLTALALATSLEVMTLVVAARRRALTSVAVGGVLGSVLYNATMTLGVATLVAPMELPDLRWVAGLAAVLPLVVLLANRLPPRLIGTGLLTGYVGYLAFAVNRPG